MDQPTSIVSPAYLIADPTRAAMLMYLLDGRARPAGELAYAAGITAQTASAHLGKLLAGGLISVEAQGRHRYYRLADDHVAHALEHLAAIGLNATARRKPLSPAAQRLQLARCCYDHLAGRLGVAVTQRLQALGFLAPAADKQFHISEAGAAWFADIGLDLAALPNRTSGFARQCLDCTEREYHLAGPLGAGMLDRSCQHGWLQRAKGSRLLQVTPVGWASLEQQLGVDQAATIAGLSAVNA
ncbi:MAG: helix-turn-helix transcriptional regulator [Burkholderiales bacterium]|nr:helix-turn-helix transcriptional regulator [Burkholderiales bacterium]